MKLNSRREGVVRVFVKTTSLHCRLLTIMCLCILLTATQRSASGGISRAVADTHTEQTTEYNTVHGTGNYNSIQNQFGDLVYVPWVKFDLSARDPGRRFFLWVHLFDPHLPHEAPAELLELERSVLLETLDTAWKDHLYETDQLRDAIGFRRFSQQDPRIAFKRECSNQFLTMMSTIRNRVGEYIFKARISPAAIIQQQRQQAAMIAQHQARQRAAAGGAAGGQAGGSVSGITGPGFATPQAPPPKGPASGADSPPNKPAKQGSDEKTTPEDALKAAQAARQADRTKERKR